MAPQHRSESLVRTRLKAVRDTGRTCGDCTACCTVMGVDELDKAQWQPCAQMRDRNDDARRCGGCSVYSDRPASCAAFKCLWLAGLILAREDDRPDRSGLVLIPVENARQAVTAFELWKGAASRGPGKRLVDRLRAAQLEVLVGNPTGMRKLTPLTASGRPVLHVEDVSPAGPTNAGRPPTERGGRRPTQVGATRRGRPRAADALRQMAGGTG